MIVTRISGGLGNQFFQYALGKNISLKNNDELKLDIGFFDLGIEKDRSFKLLNFNISANISNENDLKKIGIPDMVEQNLYSKIMRKVHVTLQNLKTVENRTIVTEKNSMFDSKILKIENSCYLSGIWQSEKYFKDIEDTIRKEFTLKNETTEYFKTWASKIENCESVCLHVRRGDYVKSQKTNAFHGTCSLEYYNEAINLILKKIKEPTFFVFSDDIDWVKDNLKIDYPKFFVSDKRLPDYEELVLMSKCKHNIIANSTFSWWGAWLNNNKDKIVIAPKKWFNVESINTEDLIPEGWIRI